MGDVLDELFGPVHRESWRELASRWDGIFYEGSLRAEPSIEVEHGPWWLRLDRAHPYADRVTHTRLQVPFVNRTGFRFHAYPAGFLSELAKVLGAQDVLIGDPLFDDAYMVKATDADLVRALLTPELRLRLLAQKSFALELRRCRQLSEAGAPVDQLHCAIPGVLHDAEQLDQLLELFVATLDQLAALGVADAQARPLRIT